MDEILLSGCVVAFMIYGFRIMKKLDIFLENNYRAIQGKKPVEAESPSDH